MTAGGPSEGEATRFRRGLLGLAGFAALSQALIQTQAYGSNPVVRVPGSDAAVIWERAGEMAAGDWVDTMPLETAPFPLWMAAAVRSLGGGLAAFGAVQSIMYVLTAVFFACIGREVARLWVRTEGAGAGPGAGLAPGASGLIAGALFVLFDEPAAGTSRVLAGTSQLFFGALCLLLIMGGDGRASLRRGAGIGALLGILCLCYPPLLAAIPLLGLWLWKGSNARVALLGVALALLAVAPATVHNYRASGELIPISSQAGLTFYHGNNTNAQGVIAPTGVVGEKRAQAAESLALAREALGPEAGWSDADRYWRGRGLAWWAEAPGQAVGVAFRKLWYAISGRRYGDIHQPWRERNDGTASRLWLAPLPLAWVLPMALMTLVLGLSRRRAWAQWWTHWAPLALFFVVPIAVCVVFFYSPRYRLPAAIAALPLAAVALSRAARGGRPAAAAAIGLGVGILSGPVNRHFDFDTDVNGTYEERHFQSMAAASGELGDHTAGAHYLEQLLALRPGDPALRLQVAKLYFVLLGDDRRALKVLDEAPPGDSMDLDLALLRGRIQTTGRIPEVLAPEAALAMADSMIEILGSGPVFLDLKAKALARMGEYAQAVAASETALSALTADHPARRGLLERLELYRQGLAYTEPAPPSPQ